MCGSTSGSPEPDGHVIVVECADFTAGDRVVVQAMGFASLEINEIDIVYVDRDGTSISSTLRKILK